MGPMMIHDAPALKLSRTIVTKIRQNYFRACFYNALMIPVAALGLLHPMLGVAAMAISSGYAILLLEPNLGSVCLEVI